jgi:hypothetical protein
MSASEKGAFFNGISNIIVISSKPQMIRFYARRVIAFMANQKTFSNIAEMYNPRCSMSLPGLFSKTELSVSLRVLFRSPCPAISCFFYLFPKTISKMSFTAFQIAIHTTRTILLNWGIAVRTNSVAVFFGRILMHWKSLLSVPYPARLTTWRGFAMGAL